MLASPDSGDHALGAAADALAQRILDRLPTLHAHTRDEIAALPTPIARVLLARLDARLDREAPAPVSDWIDPDRATDAARAWRDAARSAARVPAPAWTAFLVDACRLAVSHLVRPAETLAAVAFEDDGEAERPAALVVRRLAQFEPYPYLPDIAGRYVERKDLARLDRAGLESLLRRIDRRMVATFSADEWTDLLDPLVSLIRPPGVPGALLAAFFEAKGRDDIARTVDRSDVFTRERLHDHLAAALAEPPEPAVLEPAVLEPAPALPDEPAETDDPPPIDLPSEAAPDWRERDPDLAAWLTLASADVPTVETPSHEPFPAPRPEMPVTDTDWLHSAAPEAPPVDNWSAPPPLPDRPDAESLQETPAAVLAEPPGPPPPAPPPPASSDLAPPDDEPLWKRMMAPSDRADVPTPPATPASVDAFAKPE
ncbi:MAG TPA: hypothetical protein VF594_02100, partial [Rubricoccaceae bacterium]